jgi:hypothetical protein
MGTRSTIAIQNEDGTVTGIYCHWDGYTSNNGRILEENYTTEEAVRELIALGDLSSLGETVGIKHDFDNAPRNKCNAYGRDRGETGVDAITFGSWDDLLEKMGQEYDYLFTPGKGWVVSYFSGWNSVDSVPLAEAIQAEATQEA